MAQFNELPGNPHLCSINEALEQGEALSTSEHVALEAALAIAYELRTANMIASIQPVELADEQKAYYSTEGYIKIQKGIEERMGV